MDDRENLYEQIEKSLFAYKNCVDEKKKHLLNINIVEKAMHLVKQIAHNTAKASGVSIEDLTQVGSIGLIKAIEAFDCTKNVKFRTYATHFIKGEIKHYLRDKNNMIKAPRELQELVFKISSAIKELKSEGFDEPSNNQIAEHTGIETYKVNEVMELELCKSILSLDQAVTNFDDDDFALIDKIPSGDYQELLDSYETKIMLKEALEKLPADLKEIIELNYFHDLNQREISEKMHISQMQVSRKIRKAISKLYEIINKDNNKK